jgi:benzylsuccinate CoA-transferase BbsF subunit
LSGREEGSEKESEMVTRRALEGVKVADFSWVVAGPVTTMLLAYCGATVVRIESSSRVDLMRTVPPYKDRKPGINRSGGYAMFNNNKYGITLNLAHPKGIEIAQRMISWSDIVVENFTPGTMKKFGLSYEDIIAFKPDIIMLSTCMQGQDGPRAKHPGFGGQLTGLSGFTDLCGWPDRVPTRPLTAYTDLFGPRFAAAALVAALIYQMKQKRGQFFDLSQFETGMHFLAPAVMDFMTNGRVVHRAGNRHPFWAPHGAYPCRGDDEWCAIAVSSDKEWQNLCEAMGEPLLADDARFSTVVARKENEEALDERIVKWTAAFAREEVMIKLQSSGVPAGVIETTKDLHSDPQLAHRRHFVPAEHSEMGEYTAYMPPFRLSGTPPELERPAPCMGEHNHYVYTEMLGMSDEEFVELLSEGVFE